MLESFDLIIVVFGSICLIHGLVMSFVILSLPAERRDKTKWFLSAMLFVLSLRVGKSVIHLYDEDIIPDFATNALLGINFYIGPLLYSYFLGLQKRPTKHAFLHFLPGSLLILLSPITPVAWWQFFYLLLIVHTVIYLYLAFMQIEARFRFDNALEGWKNILFLTVSAVCASYFLVVLVDCNQYFIPVLTYAVLVYVMTIYLLKRDDIKKLIIAREKYRFSKLSKTQTKAIMQGIDKLMSSEKLHRLSEVSLKDFSVQMGVPESYISQAISAEQEMNFNELINRRRISDVCESLQNDRQRLMTIEQHAFAFGFNSTSTFYLAFKKYVGQTPKMYRNQLND